MYKLQVFNLTSLIGTEKIITTMPAVFQFVWGGYPNANYDPHTKKRLLVFSFTYYEAHILAVRFRLKQIMFVVPADISYVIGRPLIKVL